MIDDRQTFLKPAIAGLEGFLPKVEGADEMDLFSVLLSVQLPLGVGPHMSILPAGLAGAPGDSSAFRS